MEPETGLDVIAERELASESDAEKKVLIRLGRPLRTTSSDYACHYQITGPGVDVKRSAFGLDSFQAIQLAHLAIAAHIAVIEKEWDSRLRWFGRDPGF